MAEEYGNNENSKLRSLDVSAGTNSVEPGYEQGALMRARESFLSGNCDSSGGLYDVLISIVFAGF